MGQRQRTGRVIKFNHSNATPRHIISFDTETYRELSTAGKRQATHRFRIAASTEVTLREGKATERRQNRWSRPETFWDYVTSVTGPKHTTWLVGHNILFDLVISGFPEQLLTNRFYVDWPRQPRKREGDPIDDPHNSGICCIESPPTIIGLRCSKSQGRLVIVDSMNWFPVTMTELGEHCGLPAMRESDVADDDNSWFDYCQRNTDIVLETFVNLISWVKENNCGMFRYTAPSQAMAAYRHRFMRQQIYVHDNPAAKQLERMSYCGGRTEVFRLGPFRGMVNQFDINSLFPAIMRESRFPFVLDRSDTDRRLSSDDPNICWADSVAEVELQTMAPIFPVRRDGVTIYPIGKFTATLCGHELHYAAEHGYIKRIGKWAEYRCGDLFSLWVDELWQLRQTYKQQGDALREQFVKRLLNSLYGKFGQRSPGWINQSGDISSLPWSRWIASGDLPNEVVNFRSIGWNVQRQTEREEIQGSFIAISSFVTSAARMKMNALRWAAGEREVYYQGVDSLMVSNLGRERLEAAGHVNATELGKLRLQCLADDGEILGCADYRIGDKVVIAGLARQVTRDESGRLLQRKFDATRNLFSNQAVSTVDESLEPWTRAGMYKKGTVGDDGWVHPIILGICEAAMAAQGVPF